MSPSCSSTSGRGPTNVIPASAHARANCAFSDRNPYPGWTASTPTLFANPTILGMSRYERMGSPGLPTG